jgi:hypothetical protein
MVTKIINVINYNKRIILILLLFYAQNLKSQTIDFKLSFDGTLQSEFFVKSFKNGGYTLFQSNDSLIKISENKLKLADSVKLYHSFYEESFNFLKLNEGVYYSSNQMILESVIVKASKKHLKIFKYVPSGKRGKVFNSIINACQIETSNVEGRFIKGIELYFSKLRWKKKLRTTRIKQDAEFNLHVALTNKIDSINLNDSVFFDYEFTIKKVGYTYFEFNGFDQDISDFKYLIISVEPITPHMILSNKYLKKNQKGIINLNGFKKSEGLFFKRGQYLDGSLVDDRCLDFKIHYIE